MKEDRLQSQRFELKYLVPEEMALAIRDFVISYLEIDEYGGTQPNLSYPVHSLYFDSDDLKLYQSTINGDKNRFKLRLRFYENEPEAPIYFEIKRRMNNAISKQRGGVRRGAVEWLLNGHLPEPSHLVLDDPRHWLGLQRFCEHLNFLKAKPKAHVAYLREAWMSRQDNSVRVTIDRETRCEPEFSPEFATAFKNPICVFGKSAVLELKFTNRFPDWFGQLVRVFGLMQCGAAKYVDGITRYGEKIDGPTPEWGHGMLAGFRNGRNGGQPG